MKDFCVRLVTIALFVAARDWEQFKCQYLQWNSCTVEYHAAVTKRMEKKVLKCVNKEIFFAEMNHFSYLTKERLKRDDGSFCFP